MRHGISIAEDKLPHLFDRFHKADIFTQGTGLRLSIRRTTAEQLGGRIVVDSAEGRGTCFGVDIPRTE